MHAPSERDLNPGERALQRPLHSSRRMHSRPTIDKIRFVLQPNVLRRSRLQKGRKLKRVRAVRLESDAELQSVENAKQIARFCDLREDRRDLLQRVDSVRAEIQPLKSMKFERNKMNRLYFASSLK